MSIGLLKPAVPTFASGLGSEPCDRLYFLHIPKTAGTSLRYWLEDLFAAQDVLNCDIIEQLKCIDRDTINRHRFFRGHFGLEMFDYLDRPTPTVTWLREPLAREVSNFNYVRQRYDELVRIALANGQLGWIEYFDLVRSKSLAEVCQSEMYLGFSDNLQTRYLSGVFSCEYALCMNREFLERAKANLARLSFFGLCEWMAPSTDLLAYELACPRRPLSLHTNRTSGGRGSDGENKIPGADVILDVNRFDAELFEFAKSLLAKRLLDFWQSIGLLSTPNASFDDVLKKYANPEIDGVIHQAVNANFQSVRNNVVPADYFDAEFTRAVFISGWYPREHGKSNATIRWAGPRSTSSIYVPLNPKQSYVLSMNALYVASYRTLADLHVRIGELTLPIRWQQFGDPAKNGYYRIECDIPREALTAGQAFTEITLETSALVDIEIPNDQSRQVSFATDGIKLKAA